MAPRFNVRAFRDKHGLSAQRVADHLGVALRTVQRWDSGDVEPSPLALKQLQDLKAKHEPEREPDSVASDSSKPRRASLLPSVN